VTGRMFFQWIIILPLSRFGQRLFVVTKIYKKSDLESPWCKARPRLSELPKGCFNHPLLHLPDEYDSLTGSRWVSWVVSWNLARVCSLTALTNGDFEMILAKFLGFGDFVLVRSCKCILLCVSFYQVVE
jgi:hypothetical protein